MGRPLNDRYFGAFGDTGSQIALQANLGNGTETVFIVEQKGTGIYTVEDADGNIHRVSLVDGTTLAEGDAYLAVAPHGGGATEYARTVNAHDVKTFDENTYTWVFGSTTASGQASIGAEADVAPVNTVAPAIASTATVGGVLSVTAGTWTGNGTLTLTYQWYLDDVAIDGENLTTYTTTAAGTVHVVETATDAFGVSVDQASNDSTVSAA